MCQRVFNWFSWLQFLIVLIDASNEVTSSGRKDNGVASTKDLRSCVWAISVTRQTALSPLSVVRRRAQGTNARAVIKFVSRAKRSALFDLPTAQRCVCVMRWAAKEFVCAARWWMVVAGGRWVYCILISAFSKRIVYPHGCLLYLSANMNKWTNDSMYQWFSDWMQDTNEWALATNDQPLTSLLFTVQSRRWENQKEISEIGDSI